LSIGISKYLEYRNPYGYDKGVKKHMESGRLIFTDVQKREMFSLFSDEVGNQLYALMFDNEKID
jgi:hypothetical protein